MEQRKRWRPVPLLRLGAVVSLAAIAGLAAAGCDQLEGITGEPCSDNSDCDDGVFCNGQEICVGSVCAELEAPDCNDGISCTEDTCDEELRSCVNLPPDLDGDGTYDAGCLAADGVPLGTDCDDNNADRFVGNVERCDVDNLDEDCDPTTFGDQDVDGDGHLASTCCNEGPDGLLCGSDCDDEDATVVPGVQICDVTTDDDNDVRICGLDGAWVNADCFDPGVCEPQPNGRGVCIP